MIDNMVSWVDALSIRLRCYLLIHYSGFFVISSFTLFSLHFYVYVLILNIDIYRTHHSIKWRMVEIFDFLPVGIESVDSDILTRWTIPFIYDSRGPSDDISLAGLGFRNVSLVLFMTERLYIFLCFLALSMRIHRILVLNLEKVQSGVLPIVGCVLDSCPATWQPLTAVGESFFFSQEALNVHIAGSIQPAGMHGRHL